MTPTAIAKKLIERPLYIYLLSAVGAAVLVYSEHDFYTLPFVASIFAVILSISLIASGRWTFSIVTTWAFLGLVTAVSATKMRFQGVALHAFDAYFHFHRFNFESLKFLSQDYLLPILLCAGVLLFSVVVAGLFWRNERAHARYRAAASLLLIPSLFGYYLLQPNLSDKFNSARHKYYTDGHRTSSFFFSLNDIRYLFAETPLEERLTTTKTHAAYTGAVDCSKDGARPDIVMTLMESAIRPSMFAQIKLPAALEALYPAGGQAGARDLRVETWGGGTWVTTAGLLTSLPAIEFGWMRPYLPVYLMDRVQHSLPRYLKNCGYRTAVISPGNFMLFNEGPFLTSLGIDDYLDMKKIKATSFHERDSFYFNAALDYIARNRKEDGRPLFLYIMTAAAHGPYNFRFDPKTKLDGEPFGNDPEMDEYLRRLTMQRMDYAAFIASLENLPSRNGALLVDFGDHHPSVTRPLLEQMAGASPLGHWDSIAYRTYYSVTPVNMKLSRPVPDFQSLDLGYLAPTLLELGGLPLDDVYRGLIALRDRCDGAFMLCSDRGPVETHIKMLANGGLLKFDPPQKAQTAVVVPIPGRQTGVAAIVDRLPVKN